MRFAVARWWHCWRAVGCGRYFGAVWCGLSHIRQAVAFGRLAGTVGGVCSLSAFWRYCGHGGAVSACVGLCALVGCCTIPRRFRFRLWVGLRPSCAILAHLRPIRTRLTGKPRPTPIFLRIPWGARYPPQPNFKKNLTREER